YSTGDKIKPGAALVPLGGLWGLLLAPAVFMIPGKGYHSEEFPVGFYSTGDKIKPGAALVPLGGLWGLLLAPAVFMIPG
ncbi:hypothetical protein, partial [Aquitalea magnusonii]|uniref:hypothetical protein n=1 Tax=Aquitalea magnusonii TaxID=332411 RepID=UPI001957C63A